MKELIKLLEIKQSAIADWQLFYKSMASYWTRNALQEETEKHNTFIKELDQTIEEAKTYCTKMKELRQSRARALSDKEDLLQAIEIMQEEIDDLVKENMELRERLDLELPEFLVLDGETIDAYDFLSEESKEKLKALGRDVTGKGENID